MRRLFSTATGLFLSIVPLSAMDTYPRQVGVNPQHYVFALTLSDSTDQIVGESTVTMAFTKDGLTTFFLDLTTANNGKGMTVTAVTADSATGAPLRFTHARNHLNITLDRPTNTGDVRRFTVRYHGLPADGLRTGVNKFNERCFFSWNWPNKARDWLPMIDHPSAKATSEFIVTAPEKYSVVSNGLLQSEVSLGNGMKTTHWKESVPIASWLNAIGVEQFAVHHGEYVKGVELQTWVAHQEGGTAPAGFEPSAKLALEFFSDWIGPYSYEKLANVTAPFDGGATEHASAIFYGDGGTRANFVPPAATAGGGRGAAAGRGGAGGGAAGGRGSRGNGPRNASPHEIAHQWFGDAVTESDWDDIWLSEGFATYFNLLYIEHYRGHDDFIRGVRGMFDGARTQEAQTKLPVVHENISPEERQVNTRIAYVKGGSVLQMLRGQVGTETFWKAIRTYYRIYQNRNASSDDLRHVFELESGQDLHWFFAQWLHRNTIPAVAGGWSYDPASKKIIVELAQTQPGELYRLPLEVGVTADSGGGPMRTEKVDLREKRQRFEIAADRAPKDVVLDPNVWMLMDAKFVKR
jgi:aminopeptidase N